MANLLAFDFGGTFIKWGIVDLKMKKIINRGSFPTIHETLEKFLEPLFEIIDKNQNDISGITISSPGSVDVTTGIIGGVSAIKIIHGPNFLEIFKTRYNLNVTIQNDANCALLGECFNGSAQNKKNINLIVIGTGIGGACLIDGEIYNGNKNYGVEFGLLLQEYRGKLTRLSTSCGMYNIVNDITNHYNKKLTGYEIMELYTLNDSFTVSYMDGVFKQLAISCYNLQQSYNPELILLGGGISQSKTLIDRVNYFSKELFLEQDKEGILPSIEACANNNDANLYGACYQFIQQYVEKNE